MRPLVFTSAVLTAAGLAAGTALAADDSVKEFYGNTEITHIIGTSPGGSYDTVARVLARHYSRHIPGNPTVVTQNRPGASGRVAASWLYNAGPRDGSVVASLSQTLAFAQRLGQKGVNYDAAQFNWIGTPVQPISVMVASKQAGISSLLDARKKEVVVGATSSTGANFIYPALANYLFDTKLNVIIGYKGGNEVDLALERGEIGARGSATWSDIKARHPDWIKEDKVVVLVQNSLKKHPDLPNVPRFVDVSENDDQRGVLELMGKVAAIGRPMLTNQGVPEERVAALRAAFDATMKDPKFTDDAKMVFELDPLSGEELQKMVVDILATPDHIVGMTKAALSRNATHCLQFTEAKYCRSKKKKKKKE